MNGKNNARILNPKDISFHNGQNPNPNSMSPSKKLNSIGNPTTISNTAQKDQNQGNNNNNNNNNQNNQGNSGQVERISVTIPTNPLLMPNASVQI
jgi:hypothetical protein